MTFKPLFGQFTILSLNLVNFRVSRFCVSHLTCHAPNPGPTRLADPNRFPGRESQDWDSLPDFFFFFFKSQLAPVGMAHTYNNSKYYIHITESHLLIQNCTFTNTNQSVEPTCSEPYKCVGPAVCGCLLMSSPVPTWIKNTW